MTTRVCCILSALLGNRILSMRLLEAVRATATGPVPEVWFGDDSYRRHRAPRWARLSDELELESVFARQLAREGLPDADVYVVNTAGLAAVASERRPSARWLVATDATPALTDRIRARAYGEGASLPRRAFRFVQHRRFHALARRAGHWLPISAACRDSLVQDYGVPAAHCLVTSSPQAHIDRALPRRELRGHPWRLLFVGNDFARKGGPELCAAMDALPEARLTIVSRDPHARPQADGDRIELVDSITEPAELADLYRSSHLLVHPTRADHYSHVICEGLARGLPFVVSAGTPPSELVAQTRAGAPIDWPPAPASIAAAVRGVLGDAGAYEVMCRHALGYARRELGTTPFAERLRSVIDAACTDRAARTAT